MTIIRLPRLLLFALVLFALGPYCPAAKSGPETDSSDVYWDDQFAPAGANGPVYAIASDSAGNTYIGGEFTKVGTAQAISIAKWNGSKWLPLGAGIDGPVYALAVDSNGVLYAGGEFFTAGGIHTNNIARWDGSKWSALGAGITGADTPYINALACDSTGNLFAGGWFDHAGGLNASHIAKWDGAKWSSLGSGTNDEVCSIVCDQSGALYAGGWFDRAGGLNASHIAKWSGSKWSSLSTGIDGAVYALARNSAGLIYAAGYFHSAGGVSVNNIAKWSGSKWSALETGIGGGIFPEVKTLVCDSTGTLYAGGAFTLAGGTQINNIAKWDGSNWSALGSAQGMDDTVYALACTNSGSLCAGGAFKHASGVEVNHATEWNGSKWSTLGMGAVLNGTVFALVSASTGAVYAGGAFTLAGGAVANHIAKWDGSKWSPLGKGIDGVVYALACDSSGTLYAGGSFSYAGGVEASRIAKWDGSRWSRLGTGLNKSVLSLVCDSYGRLYAGGRFDHAGLTTASGIAKWDGSRWSTLGEGLGASYSIDPGGGYRRDPVVFALAFDPMGNLYAGGDFDAGGTHAEAIAKWNGSRWSGLGAGLEGRFYGSPSGGDFYDPPSVSALASDPYGNIYISGDFSSAGRDENITDSAKWDGSNWFPAHIGGSASALVCDSSGNLYHGRAGPNGIAKWDGENWSGFGSGVDGSVSTILLQNNALFTGGAHITAGGKASYRLALWQPRVNDRWTTFSASPGAKTLGGDIFSFYKPALKTYSGTALSHSNGRLPVSLGLARAEPIYNKGKRINGAFSLKPGGITFGGTGATLRVEFSEDDATSFGTSYKSFIPVRITYPNNYPASKEAVRFQEMADASAPAPIRMENGRQIYAITFPIHSIPNTSANFGAVPRSSVPGTPVPTSTRTRTPTIAPTPTRTPTRTLTPTRVPTLRPPTQSRHWEKYY